MNEILMYCLFSVVFGVFLGLLISAVNIASAFRKDPDAIIKFFSEQRDSLIQSQTENSEHIMLYLDKVDSTFMVYENNTDRFITQGDTDIEAIKLAQDIFADKIIVFNIDRLYPELVSSDSAAIHEIINNIYDKLD